MIFDIEILLNYGNPELKIAKFLYFMHSLQYWVPFVTYLSKKLNIYFSYFIHNIEI